VPGLLLVIELEHMVEALRSGLSLIARALGRRHCCWRERIEAVSGVGAAYRPCGLWEWMLAEGIARVMHHVREHYSMNEYF
jgi:hypothetical protein